MLRKRYDEIGTASHGLLSIGESRMSLLRYIEKQSGCRLDSGFYIPRCFLSLCLQWPFGPLYTSHGLLLRGFCVVPTCLQLSAYVCLGLTQRWLPFLSNLLTWFSFSKPQGSLRWRFHALKETLGAHYSMNNYFEYNFGAH